MENIIVWNDLPLFCNGNNNIDDDVFSIFGFLGNACKCHFYSYEQTKEWAQQFKNNGISIGRRPNKLFPSNINIVSYREKDPCGKANATFLESNSIDVLRKYICRNDIDNVIIYEDAIVEGKTMELVVREIRTVKNIPISVKCLFAVENATNWLREEFEDLHIECLSILPGEPLQDSTILFMSDLISKDPVLSIPFIDNERLMRPCFYNDLDTVKTAVKSLVVEKKIKSYMYLHYVQKQSISNLYICDLDDTLANSNGIDGYVAEELRKLLDKRVPFSIATARSYDGMVHKLKGMELSYPSIHYNGALICCPASKKAIFFRGFHNKELNGILLRLLERGSNLLCIAYHNGLDRAYVIDSIFNSTLMERIEKLPISARPEIVSVDQFRLIGNCLTIYEYSDKHALNGIGNTYRLKYGNQYVPYNVNKGIAAKVLASYIGAENIIAFGNGTNDIALFKEATSAYCICSNDCIIHKELYNELRSANEIFSMIEEFEAHEIV